MKMNGAQVKNGDVLLLVGTMKGLFLLRAGPRRGGWGMSGPFFPGQSLYSVAYDGRAGVNRIWAGPSSMHFGAELCSSDDFGATWDRPETPRIRFPESAGASLVNIWQIVPGREEEPERLYCGVQPSALFESRDAGKTWSLNDGLWNHPHRPRWTPGNGGLCLHSIVFDPVNRGRLSIATSTGGVYRSDDGGKNWEAKNRGIGAYFLPDKQPQFGQCVHRIVQHPSRPGRLFAQNHFGLYRSDDAGELWRDIANGVPSDFGFCMASHPNDPDTVFIVPLHSDGFRCVPEGKLRVYRTKNGGASWQALSRGLPQKDAYETVVRDAMATDTLDPAGVYFGTRSGKLFGSRDEGRSWELLRDGLPAVCSVRAAVIRGLPRARRLGKAPAPQRPAAA
ncbi:MAG: WD40/YVTN/BNR-like repeat-containing protein [Thermoanaerobaculia bacterium]